MKHRYTIEDINTPNHLHHRARITFQYQHLAGTEFVPAEVPEAVARHHASHFNGGRLRYIRRISAGVWEWEVYAP